MVYEVILYSPPTKTSGGSNKILWVRANNTDIIHEYFKDTNFEVQKIEETTLPDNMRGIDVSLDGQPLKHSSIQINRHSTAFWFDTTKDKEET